MSYPAWAEGLVNSTYPIQSNQLLHTFWLSQWYDCRLQVLECFFLVLWQGLGIYWVCLYFHSVICWMAKLTSWCIYFFLLFTIWSSDWGWVNCFYLKTPENFVRLIFQDRNILTILIVWLYLQDNCAENEKLCHMVFSLMEYQPLCII